MAQLYASVCLTSLNAMYIQYLTEVIPSYIQNIVGVCKQITILILYYVTSTLVTFLYSFIPLYTSLMFILFVSRSSIYFSDIFSFGS